MRNAYRFFCEHAGHVVGQRAAGALDLANAEKEANVRGWEYSWEPDYDDCADGDVTPSERYGCILRDVDGSVLASLSSIGDPSREYMRAVMAELALEAMAEGKSCSHRAHILALGMCE